ncbi:hypothetical protein, partial [Xanthomonas indica]
MTLPHGISPGSTQRQPLEAIGDGDFAATLACVPLHPVIKAPDERTARAGLAWPGLACAAYARDTRRSQLSCSRDGRRGIRCLITRNRVEP